MLTDQQERPYRRYSDYIRETFGGRVQKVSLDTGFTCPNRDGSKGHGGCTYCNNHSFNPDYCEPRKSILTQIQEGIDFFKHKYQGQKYLAYFQAYTNTYADISILKSYYDDALAHPDVIGLVVGTRPDCINETIVELLADYAKDYYVSLEFGVESTINRTLDLVNRCHSFEETRAAYDLAKDRGFELGAHMIIGLPGESREDILSHASQLSALPINSLKLHQLQIIKNTMMAYQYRHNPDMFNLFDVDEYVDLMVDFVSHLRPDIVIERFTSESPADLLIAPKWGGIKNFAVATKIEQALIASNNWQGKSYQNSALQ
jgi:radical SAM protein (TIGR01212 family)